MAWPVPLCFWCVTTNDKMCDLSLLHLMIYPTGEGHLYLLYSHWFLVQCQQNVFYRYLHDNVYSLLFDSSKGSQILYVIVKGLRKGLVNVNSLA